MKKCDSANLMTVYCENSLFVCIQLSSHPHHVPRPPYHYSWRQSIVNRYCDNILYSARLSNKFCFKASLSIYNKKGSKCLPFPTSSCLDKGLFFRKNKTISLHLLTSTKHASLNDTNQHPFKIEQNL